MRSYFKVFRICLILSIFIIYLRLPVLGNSGEDEDYNRDLQVLKAIKPLLPANVAKTGVTEGFAIIVFYRR